MVRECFGAALPGEPTVPIDRHSRKRGRLCSLLVRGATDALHHRLVNFAALTARILLFSLRAPPYRGCQQRVEPSFRLLESSAMTERPSQEVIAKLVDRNRSLLKVLERLSDHVVAEDIQKNAFAQSRERAAELRDDTCDVTWLYRLLRNAVIDHDQRVGAGNRKLVSLAREMEGAVEAPREMRFASCTYIAHLASTRKVEHPDAIQHIEVNRLPVPSYACVNSRRDDSS